MHEVAPATRILVIASFPQSLVGFRGALLQTLLDAGHSVHVAAPDLPTDSPVRLTLERWGVVVHEISMRRAGMNPVEDAATLRSLWSLCSTVAPTHVLAYTVKPVVYGLWAARLAHVPNRLALITGLGYAFTEQATGRRRFVAGVVHRLYANALRGCKRVFFQNPDDRAVFQRLRLLPHMVPTTVVNGSGVDVSTFEVAQLPQVTRFLLIARLLGAKGVREYAEAAQRLKADYVDAVFRLVGWIDDTPDAIQQSELDAWVADGSVEYLGKLDDVRPAIAECTVYVLPSYREGTPRTVLEAMAMGRPIITTDAPGCRETVVDGENGFLVGVKAVDELERAMRKFIIDPELAARMGERSRRIAEDRYDVHKVNAVMLEGMGL